jgi:hypothetical protein
MGNKNFLMVRGAMSILKNTSLGFNIQFPFLLQMLLLLFKQKLRQVALNAKEIISFCKNVLAG